MLLVPLLALAPLVPTALAWGAAGHEIVATIAQVHLYPETKEALLHILPPEAKGHLAPIAAWADQVRMRWRNGAMHYVNGINDHPADHCEFGEDGWANEDVNVLTAIANFTGQVMNGKGDIPIRFLTHFVGDMHQPLHLTGRDKGGNGAMFLFEGRHRNLHSVWDSGILTKNIRELSNYTTPLPSKQIESALLGAIFDPYVRFILWEGMRGWWSNSIEGWLACPAGGDPYPHSSVSNIPAPDLWLNTVKGYTASALKLLPSPLSAFLAEMIPLQAVEGFSNDLLALHPTNVKASSRAPFPACPYTWAKPLHKLNCESAWPKEYTGSPGSPLIELDTDVYLGKLARDNTMEMLLAMGGVRLAHLLNTALSGKEGVYLAY